MSSPISSRPRTPTSAASCSRIAGFQADLAAIPGQLDALMAEFAAFREANAPALALIAQYRAEAAGQAVIPLRA